MNEDMTDDELKAATGVAQTGTFCHELKAAWKAGELEVVGCCGEEWRTGVAQTGTFCHKPAGHEGPHEYPYAWPPKGRKR